jgi:hypothetical protein
MYVVVGVLATPSILAVGCSLIPLKGKVERYHHGAFRKYKCIKKII